MTTTNPRRGDTRRAVIADFSEFYRGAGYMWFTSIASTAAETLRVTAEDPNPGVDADHLFTVDLTASDIHTAFEKALSGTGHLCCLEAIRDDCYGVGCADDIDTILQVAIYGEVIYS